MSDLNAVNESFREEWITGPGDHPFYTRLFISPNRPRAAVLFLHGFLEHVGRYETVFPTWAAKDIAVFAFDQRGFGRTWSPSGDGATKAKFGETSGADQIRDIEFFLKELACKFPDTPIFLMGFSIGGARALHFVTRTSQPPAPETLKLLSGVIAYSPHLLPTYQKWIGTVFAIIAKIIPANTTFHIIAKAEDLSQNAVTNREWEQDTLIQTKGTIRAINDLVQDGEELVVKGYNHWPEALPVLFLHGSDDPKASPAATRLLHDSISATDKTYAPFPKAYHELHNDARDAFNDTCISWIEHHLDQTGHSN